MNIRRILSLFCATTLCLLLLHGCATMSEAECRAANWEQRGEDDALAGHPRSYVNEHTNACADYGLTPDLESYRVGWERGIKDYCTRDHGWQVGISGGVYENTCPAAMQTAFLSAYQSGKKLYDQQQLLNNLDAELSEINYELDSLPTGDEKKESLKKKRKRLKKDHGQALFLLLLYQSEARGAGYQVP